METFQKAIMLLFGGNSELRQIIATTLVMSVSSTVISSLFGLSLGTFLGGSEFRGKKIIIRTLHTFMSLPPVVAGLVVFMLLSRKGPLGSFGLLFTVKAMVIAQVLLITPIIAGMCAAVVSSRAPSLLETTRGLGISRRCELWLLFTESRMQLVSVALLGFGRAIAEVGAVQLVGGNIQHKTRVMTTSIVLETNMGNFEFGIALGIILLMISFAVNSLAQILQEKGA